ncbi:MAG: glycosyltransferase [Nitrospira sp. CR1.2]|jgi:glycosyltransferase involved in cell wall biosynthesis|nr:glycosyltransferase [Nitrospira sp. CR1.2]
MWSVRISTLWCFPAENKQAKTGSEMGNKNFLSVVVPVYNGGWCLGQCLAGIQRSSYREYELIVVDNGSTDNSVAIAQAHGALVAHCPGPSGPGAARNTGVKLATGQILLFVDADVVVHNDVLNRVVARFIEDTELAAVFGSYDDSPPAKNFLSQYKNLLHHYVHQQANNRATTFWGGCGAIRKDVFVNVGGFDQEKYPTPSIEDIELGDRMHRLGYRIWLDKGLQATHLKEWRWKSLLRAEILYRAIPWSRLIHERQGLVNDLNLKLSHRASAAVAGLFLAMLPLTPVFPPLAYGCLFLASIFLLLNRDLFVFFLRRRGVLFSAVTVPMHGFYYIYSGVTFVLVWLSYALHLR